MFFQWTMASGIFIMGIFFYMFQCGSYVPDSAQAAGHGGLHQCPSFQPFAMLGGVLWATGNVLTVPIVKTVGLSLGLLTWGMTNMVVGWASARFGVLGVFESDISNKALNMVGVAIAVLSMGIFVFIKPTVKNSGSGSGVEDEQSAAYAQLHQDLDAEELNKSLVGGLNADSGSASGGEQEEQSWTDKLSPQQKSIFGFGASVAAGLLYGVNFNPPTYVANHMCDLPPAAMKCPLSNPSCWQPYQSGCFVGTGSSWDAEPKSYIFSHFVGIWLASSLYFGLYCALTKNRPAIFGEATFPGIISGMIWATAQVSWFFANANLDQATAFPIISCVFGKSAGDGGVPLFPPSPPPSLSYTCTLHTTHATTPPLPALQHWPWPHILSVGHVCVW